MPPLRRRPSAMPGETERDAREDLLPDDGDEATELLPGQRSTCSQSDRSMSTRSCRRRMSSRRSSMTRALTASSRPGGSRRFACLRALSVRRNETGM